MHGTFLKHTGRTQLYLAEYSDLKMLSKGSCGAREVYIVSRCCSGKVHPIFRISRKFCSLKRSSNTAEILSSVDVCDMTLNIGCLLHEILYSRKIYMLTDSCSTFNLEIRIKESKDNMDKVDPACVCEAYERNLVDIMCSVSGTIRLPMRSQKNDLISIARIT